jgi:hypothetical protein
VLPAVVTRLTPEQFNALNDVPPETEWLANITNEKTKRAYRIDVAEFVLFSGLRDSASLRTVARAHVIAWRISESPEAGRCQHPAKTLVAIVSV